MPATWTQADDTTWWWWTHVADLGPYTGPVPPSAPAWIPSDANEVDFVIGRPHPSGDVRRFRDGTYDAGHLSGAYLYTTGDGLFIPGTYGDMTTLDPGAHLFVQFYPVGNPAEATPAPSVPPLGLVPAALIPGGYGPTIGAGHWSDWRAGEVHTEAASWAPLLGAVRAGAAAHDGTPVDGPALVEQARSYIQAGAGPSWSLGNGATGPGYQERADGYPVGYLFSIEKVGYAPDGGAVCRAEVGMSGATFDATAGAAYRNPSPAELSGLTEGVDYGPDPVTGDLVQYDPSGTSAFQGWDDWTVASNLYTWNPQGYDFIHASSLRLKVKDGGGSAGYLTSTSGWADIGGIPFDTAHNVGLGASFDSMDRTDVFSLAALGEPVYSVMAYPEVADPAVALGLTNDVPVPSSGLLNQDQHYLTAARLNSTSTITLWEMQVAGLPAQFGALHRPQARWRQPRWRYWVPGGVEFHCPSGYSPKVTTVEGHWSDWQPGYTVDSASDIVTGSNFHAAPANIGFFAREDITDGVGSSIGILDALTAAQVQASSGGADFTRVPSSPSAGGLIWNVNFAHNATTLGYIAGSVTLPYYAYAIEPATAYLPCFRSLNQPHFFADAVENLQYAQIPSASWPDMRNPSPYDDRDGRYYVDWEQPVGTWHHWSTVQGFLGLRASYYYDHGDPGAAAPWHGPDTIPMEIGTTFYIAGGSDSEFAPVLAPDPWPGTGVLNTIEVHLPGVYSDGDFVYELRGGGVGFNEDISGEGRQFTLTIRNGWLSFPGHYPYITPDLDQIADSGAAFNSNIYPWPGGIWTTPRWRYWIPTVDTYQCVGAGAVRLTQRNDGLGVSRHPRLDVGNAPSSQQANRAARVNRNNTYS